MFSRVPLTPTAAAALAVAVLGLFVLPACRGEADVPLFLIAGGDGTPVGAPEPVADGLYLVRGGGGNTAVFVTPSAVVVVDPKYAASWPALAAAVRAITDRPITHAILTHSHSDHAEAVVDLPASVRIVAQGRTLDRLLHFSYLPRGPATEQRLTRVDERLVLFEGDDTVTLFHPGAAHTDGDLVVSFDRARVLHLGDLFPGPRFPIINIEGGGDGRHFPDALQATLGAFPAAERVITGHGAVLGRQDLADYAAFVRFSVDYVRAEMRMFKDKAAVFRALPLPDRFRDYDRTRQFDTLDEIDRSLRPRWQRIF
ncbi:MAG: MBL fold metallo-hydrolase [Vicinamibacterales bacterium]